MTKLTLITIAALLLSACSSIPDIEDPYAPPPKTCAAIDSERAELNEFVGKISSVRSVKDGGSFLIYGLVALQIISPIFAPVPLVFDALTVDLEPAKNRARFLAKGRLHLDCGEE